MVERGVPRHGYELADGDGAAVIGHVTSGTMSPMLNVGIGLGYVASEHAAVGTPLTVVIRNRFIKAEVVRLPFV